MTSPDFDVQETYDNLCHVLSALRGADPADRAPLERAAEALLGPEIEFSKALTMAHRARSPLLVRAILSGDKDAGGPKVLPGHFRASLRFGEIAAECDVDLMAAYRDNGVNLGGALDTLLDAAHRADDARGLAFVKACRPGEALYRNSAMDDLIARCGPKAAPFLAEDLVRDGGWNFLGPLFNRTNRELRLKTFAVLLAFNAPLAAHRDQLRARLGPQGLALFERTSSHHGRLYLAGLERDPMAVLGRSAGDTFYGLDLETWKIGILA